MNMLAERLESLAGPSQGVDPRRVADRARQRRRHRNLARSAVGATVLVMATVGVVATRGPDTVELTTATTSDTSVTSPSGPFTATTPDGIELSWRIGTYDFSRCFLPDDCSDHQDGEPYPTPGVRVRFELPDGSKGEQTVPVSASASGSPVHVGASWEGYAGLAFVAVRTDPTVATLQLTLLDGRVDTRPRTGAVTVFASLAAPIGLTIGRIEAFDAAGNTITRCVAVQYATDCN